MIKNYANTTNKNGSFASEKYNCRAKWLVEGHEYYSHLYDRLNGAKETIFIAGWWVSPEIPLKRPLPFEMIDHESRLMNILKKKVSNNKLNIRLKKA